ncbi:MAG: DNA replication/repair protein RecF [Hyphomicrobiales bacterium]|nr:DNA replication/repair protein RecF [Hyphomicrobiales bacterium]
MALDIGGGRISVARLMLTDFRNIAGLRIEAGGQCIVLTGKNGAGKSNLLESVSLLAPGKGLRNAASHELTRHGAGGGWSVAATLVGRDRMIAVGTGAHADPSARAGGRAVRIDGVDEKSSSALDCVAAVLWLTPAMDGLFLGPAAERRRFLDRLAAGCAPSHRTQVSRFELAMRHRNRLLETGAPARTLAAYERQMAEHAVAVAAARVDAVERLRHVIEARRAAGSAFPSADVRIEGELERDVAERPAVDVEDAYADALREGRERDRAARRALVGPHASDLAVWFAPKAMPAKLCSTGEQKALLIGLILAQADLVKQARAGEAPILLFDEVAAHLDQGRREALFNEIFRLDSQAWLTGTHRRDFQALEGRAQFLHVADGAVNADEAHGLSREDVVVKRMRAK